MTLYSLLILASFLFLGGLIPSISSLAVLSRASTSGFVYGFSTAIGIALGDIVFILTAIYGVTLLSGNINSVLSLIKFLGAAYLIYLGTVQWQTTVNKVKAKKLEKSTFYSSLLTGLLITLADQKAILFYLGFFPALFDLAKVTLFDTTMIVFVTLIALVSAKLCYAYMGSRTKKLFVNEKYLNMLNKLVASFLVALGIYIMLTTSAV